MNASDNLEMYLSRRTKIYDMPIGKLTPYANNPRLNDEAVPAVAESIRLFGFKVPMIVDRNFVVVAGHTRLKAAKSLGLETVPCILADDLTEDEINAFRLADNKSGEIAQWDGRALLEELQKLAAAVNPIDMGQFGFESVDELRALRWTVCRRKKRTLTWTPLWKRSRASHAGKSGESGGIS